MTRRKNIAILVDPGVEPGPGRISLIHFVFRITPRMTRRKTSRFSLTVMSQHQKYKKTRKPRSHGAARPPRGATRVRAQAMSDATPQPRRRPAPRRNGPARGSFAQRKANIKTYAALALGVFLHGLFFGSIGRVCNSFPEVAGVRPSLSLRRALGFESRRPRRFRLSLPRPWVRSRRDGLAAARTAARAHRGRSKFQRCPTRPLAAGTLSNPLSHPLSNPLSNPLCRRRPFFHLWGPGWASGRV